MQYAGLISLSNMDTDYSKRADVLWNGSDAQTIYDSHLFFVPPDQRAGKYRAYFQKKDETVVIMSTPAGEKSLFKLVPFADLRAEVNRRKSAVKQAKAAILSSFTCNS